jgi:hypothetical protein
MYHTSFSLDEKQEIKEYFETHGYVAIRDVFSKEECEQTFSEIGEEMKKKSPNIGFDIHNVKTYDNVPRLNNYGMFTSVALFTPQMLRNRENPRMYEVFSLLYGEENLIINHDSCCLYRPTNLPDLKKPEWSTAYSFPELHLDFHPAGYEDIDAVVEKRNQLNYKDLRDFMTENNMYCEKMAYNWQQ